MCGIFGLWQTHGEIDLNIAKIMSRKLKHRGPDDEGFLLLRGDNAWASCGSEDTDARLRLPSIDSKASEPWNLIFGHRRLSILDLSEAGHQPMSAADERYWITFNGEVYNYVELREELKKFGHQFVSNTDTEVVLRAFLQWDRNCLTKFIGMFAFGIFDRKEQRLFLARDFFGIKPLYYQTSGTEFIFASEIKAFQALPHWKRQVNSSAVVSYLEGVRCDFYDQTYFEDIFELPAGHFIDRRLGFQSPQPSRYWRAQIDSPIKISYLDASEELKRLFQESVSLHLRSDVPVGSALSGGIDSSAVVMMAHKLLPESDLQCFSYIANSPRLNEAPWVDMVVKSAHVRSFQTSPTSFELLKDLDQLIEIQDQPFGGTSVYAQYRVFQLARSQGIKVMLDGQGADELLGGYVAYYMHALYTFITTGKLYSGLRLAKFIRKTAPEGIDTNLLRFAYQQFRTRLFKKTNLPSANLGDHQNISKFKVPAEMLNPTTQKSLHQRLRQTLEQELPSLLRYEDRNSMAHSIESRVPFLTPQLVSFVYSLPPEYLVSPLGVRKAIFRNAMKDIVPKEILARPDKLGFETTQSAWVRDSSSYVRDIFKGKTARANPFLDSNILNESWRRVETGQEEFSHRHWRWLNFLRWAELNSVTF